ncbi:hypothetical protein F5Y18DRAFT_366925 [Xylariaceae sp. FL1019]|nr:hypothetical protein F5Y18DRAFT_366925 [Xylariaceae sp. FL1019]
MSSSTRIAEPYSVQYRAHSVQDTPPSIKPSSIGVESVSKSMSSSGQKLRLALLQPLAQPEVLHACRNPSSRFGKTCPSGRPFRKSEVLDLTALDKAWRRAVSQSSPASVIVFDLSLPKLEEATHESGTAAKEEIVAEGESTPQDRFKKVYWTVSQPDNDDAVGVELRDVMRTAVTIASTTRMRAPQGQDVRFDVVINEEDKPPRRGGDRLKQQLTAIAQSSDPRPSDSHLVASLGAVNLNTDVTSS